MHAGLRNQLSILRVCDPDATIKNPCGGVASACQYENACTYSFLLPWHEKALTQAYPWNKAFSLCTRSSWKLLYVHLQTDRWLAKRIQQSFIIGMSDACESEIDMSHRRYSEKSAVCMTRSRQAVLRSLHVSPSLARLTTST